MQQGFSVTPVQSTQGPLVHFTTADYLLHPERATDLGVKLMAATAIARYESALIHVLRTGGIEVSGLPIPDEEIDRITTAVRAELERTSLGDPDGTPESS